MAEERYYDTSDTAIIRDVGGSEIDQLRNYQDGCDQLERALEDGCHTIVIELQPLGDETVRWISVGNFLHQTAVYAGLGAIVSGFVGPNKPALFMPLACTSLLCTGVYTISWQLDPCCQYQVSEDPHLSCILTDHFLFSASSVILVKKDNFRKKLLHRAVTLASTILAGYNIYIIGLDCGNSIAQYVQKFCNFMF
ncbi:transmembrane protein 11-B, mitochondrial-like [Macrosteles quadrilineatus]|uniref:transmembrane protein 11-B, mitochondrial-like n=1 Tax=Macrosteles quadrilineatus TaxID=74068 RepID=UPI0023E1BCFC|nr:transmembrane protein 11-B, mitochondrial-like [Macrosteles quadrilineatus]